MVSKVVVTRKAQKQLSSFVGYIIHTFKNKEAAKSLTEDSKITKQRLLDAAESLPLCKDEDLAALGYKTIHFKSHRYLFIFEIRGSTVYVEATYHELQDYENIFKSEVQNS